jgi:hypothetical protein
MEVYQSTSTGISEVFLLQWHQYRDAWEPSTVLRHWCAGGSNGRLYHRIKREAGGSKSGLTVAAYLPSCTAVRSICMDADFWKYLSK